MTHADAACKTWRYSGANAKVADILIVSVPQAEGNITELRVLDLGAGHGLMGEALCKYGVSRMVGVDIIAEAREAAERDRPHIYDHYDVIDLCNPTADESDPQEQTKHRH